MSEKWDGRFLELANHISEWSKDPSKKVGAVIVDENRRVVSLGYNGFPRGVDDTKKERYENRETKYKFVVHAERNALDNAPLMVDGCTLYVNLLPCHECAKSVIQRGIRRVVAPTPKNIGENPYNWDVMKTMFEESGVKLIEIPVDF